MIRVAGALSELALARTVSWSEAELVLDAIARFDRAREDLVELVAEKRFDFYKAIGGTRLTLGAFRSKVRHELPTGEHI